MKSSSQLLNLATTLTQNLSAANQALMLQLMDDEQRLDLQDYFDNEREYQTTTVGAMSLTATASLSVGATSATLTASWIYPTVTQLVTFSDGDQRSVLFTNGSTAISWTGGLTNNSTTALSTAGVQNYTIPAQISKITSAYIQVGQLRFVPVPIQTRVDWDRVNFLPYSSDIVNYAFIYNDQMRFWPIPSTTGDIIQFNYKARIPSFSTAFLFSDTSGTAYVAGATTFTYQKGTVTPPAVGAVNVTGASTSWNTTGAFPLNTDVSYFNLFFKISQPNGDGIWYPISQFASDTSLILATPIQNQPTSAGGASYEIGQMPVLFEDFHDAIIYGRPLQTYYSSIVDDEGKFKQYQALHQVSVTKMESYLGTKQVNVDLEAEPVLSNPNNYPYAQP
jgi:hypothetical protein